MKEFLNKTKSVLIIPSNKLDLDLISSTFALSESLRLDGKDVKILIDEKSYPKFMSKIISPGNNKFLEPQKPKDYVISVKNNEAEIEDVKWEQKDENINIIITTSKGNINPDKIEVQELNMSFDLIILIGFENLDSLDQIGTFYLEHKEIFSQEKLLIIGNKDNLKIAKNNFTSTSVSSLSELVTRFLNEYSFDIKLNIPDLLLTGIYWRTNSLSANIKSESVFEIIKLLIGKGGDVEKSARRANQTLKLIETKLVSEVLKNIKITKDYIAVSIIDKLVSQNVKFEELLYQNWDLMQNIIETKVSIIIINRDGENLVYIHSNTPQVKADELVVNYHGTGGTQKSFFKTNLAPEVIESELVLKVSSLLIDNVEKNRIEKKIQFDVNIGKKEEKKEIVMSTTPIKLKSAEKAQPIQNVIANENKGNEIISQPTAPESSPIQPIYPSSYNSQGIVSSMDPLKPAQSIPEPIKLGTEPKPQAVMSPLPPAE